MSGAYTAKPAVAATPDPPIEPKPPGWGDWPFPGPWPPGYEPELTFPMTADATVRVGSPAAVAGSIRDHVEYITSEPDDAVLSATIDGESISISPDSSVFGEGAYWNISDDVTFGITSADEGKTIVVTGVSAVTGEAVTGTVNITVYAPVYSLNLSGSSTIGVSDDASVSVTVSLRDHGTLGTNEPSGSTITWTATIDGASVDLRFSGDAGYSSSIESVYSDIGDYYGAEEDIEFDLDDDDLGKTLILRADSEAFGENLDATHDIDVVGVAYAVFECNMSGSIEEYDLGGIPDNGHYLGGVAIGREGYDPLDGPLNTPYAYVALEHYGGPEAWVFYRGQGGEAQFEAPYPITTPAAGGADGDFSWRVGECGEDQSQLSIVDFTEHYPFPWSEEGLVYDVTVAYGSAGFPATLTYTFKTYSANDELLETYTKIVTTIIPAATDTELWLQIDGGTKEVTVVNP